MSKFMQDLQVIYNEVSKRNEELNSYFNLAKNQEHLKAKELVDRFLEHIELPVNKESIVASLNYLINLREDNLVQFMQKLDLTQNDIDKKLDLAYNFNSKLYIKRFEQLISWIKEKELLTPFYREIISGVHNIGIVMTTWQTKWKSHIINKINRELFELFKGDEDKIFQMLESKQLLDCKDGEIADRCYSVLVKDGNGYKRLSYAEAFKDEVRDIVKEINVLISKLEVLEDNEFNQKQEWINYFLAIKEAFLHTEVDNLVSLWADVDRAWMKITTPIQVGHPLEYYEDKYRKAVALEWDLRIVNPSLQNSSKTKNNIKKSALQMADDLEDNSKKVIAKNLIQVDNAQLYIGQPVLFYGAELNGLFSAQVVPNDEAVSAELGKKIFAYLDFVRESKKSKPVMQLAVDTFGKEFIKKQQDLIQNNPNLWNTIYDISTIGHEFGHILWIDSDTEVVMNKSGQFKNIEEFKATSGGIMAFFQDEKEELKEPFIDDIISRAVSLMAWREVGEVLPYYCEGLIHLDLLYNSGIINFVDTKVVINYDKYSSFKNSYLKAYKELATSYLKKEDATNFLGRFTIKEENIFMPKQKDIYKFVQSYYEKYQRIGNQVAKDFN